MIANNTSTVSYTTNGLTKVFTIPFPFFKSTDLSITLNGNAVNTGISVSGGNNSTGSLTFVNAPEAGQNLLIIRVMELTQPFDFIENPFLSMKDVEDAYDRLVMLIQQIQRDVTLDRALKIPLGDSAVTTVEAAATRANKYLAFDSDGNVVTIGSIQLGTAKGSWTTVTEYKTGDLVYDPSNSENLYYVLNDYTSSASIATDISNNDLKLLLVAPEAVGIQNNYSATTNPSASNNASENYEVGSEWINTSTNDAYKLTSFTGTDAVWTQISGSGTGNGVPTGTLAWWPVSTTPDGYLACDGTAISKAAYPDLYNILKDGGAECIYGEDTTTFNLPNAEERYIRCAGDTNSVSDLLDDANKEHNHTASVESAGSHTHAGSTNTAGNHTHAIYLNMYLSGGSGHVPYIDPDRGTGPGWINSDHSSASGSGSHSHVLNIQSAGSHTHNISVSPDGESEARPKSIVFQLCIKT